MRLRSTVNQPAVQRRRDGQRGYMHLNFASREGGCRRTQFGVIDCRRGAVGEQLGNQGLLGVRRGAGDIISAMLVVLDILALATILQPALLP